MTTFIVLTPAQAEQVETANLRPRYLETGEYILPLSVLDDAIHVAQWPILRECERREIELPEAAE